MDSGSISWLVRCVHLFHGGRKDEWVMTDAEALEGSLTAIADRVSDDMSERDVENLFVERGFYDALGYEGTGSEIRSEFTLPDDRRPDYITLDANERVTAVYEFRTSGRDLEPHRDQLRGYMEELKADYGVLTNGDLLELHERGGSRGAGRDVRRAADPHRTRLRANILSR